MDVESNESKKGCQGKIALDSVIFFNGSRPQ